MGGYTVAEAELTAMRAVASTVKPQDVERLVGLVMERYRAVLRTLELSLPIADVEVARAHLRGIFGSIGCHRACTCP